MVGRHLGAEALLLVWSRWRLSCRKPGVVEVKPQGICVEVGLAKGVLDVIAVRLRTKTLKGTSFGLLIDWLTQLLALGCMIKKSAR